MRILLPCYFTVGVVKSMHAWTLLRWKPQEYLERQNGGGEEETPCVHYNNVVSYSVVRYQSDAHVTRQIDSHLSPTGNMLSSIPWFWNFLSLSFPTEVTFAEFKDMLPKDTIKGTVSFVSLGWGGFCCAYLSLSSKCYVWIPALAGCDRSDIMKNNQNIFKNQCPI